MANTAPDQTPPALIQGLQDLIKAIIESGNIGHLLLCFFFLGGIVALIATASMGEWLVFAGILVLSIGGMAVAVFIIAKDRKPKPPRITPAKRAKRTEERVEVCLDGICQMGAVELGIDRSLLRSNVFREWSDHLLRIIPGWHCNMENNIAEQGVEIPIGYGSTGNAYAEKKPVIARAIGGWGKYILSDTEMAKVHPDLKWIISVPIPRPRSCGEILGVVNLDCRQRDLSVDELRPAQEQLLHWAFQMGEEIEGSGQEDSL